MHLKQNRLGNHVFEQLLLGLTIIVFFLAFFPSRSFSQTDTIVKKVIVGVKITPPFVMKNSEGEYQGVSVDLWENVADNLGLLYEYKEYNLEGVLQAIEDEEVDICINPLTVTSNRLKTFDFTQPYYISNLAIAVPAAESNELWIVLKQFFSFQFFKAVFLLFGIILVFGFLLWLVEYKKNDQFRPGLKGIGDGIWWSAVTMTTVGYGDKAPVTFLGRIVATVWMFTAVITISSFTAGFTTTLTLSELGALEISSLDDLYKAKVGTIAGSSSAEFLDQKGIKFSTFRTVEEGLSAVALDQLEAFVYDEPVIEYSIEHHDFGNAVTILPQDFNTEYYSFGLPDKHPLLDTINPTLIEEIESRNWRNILRDYHIEED